MIFFVGIDVFVVVQVDRIFIGRISKCKLCFVAYDLLPQRLIEGLIEDCFAIAVVVRHKSVDNRESFSVHFVSVILRSGRPGPICCVWSIRLCCGRSLIGKHVHLQNGRLL